MTHSELQALLQLLRERGRPARFDVAEMRARYELLGEKLAAPDGAVRDTVTIEGRTAEIIAAPGSDPGRCILYLHGGGYVLGSPNTHRNLAHGLSAASGAEVLVLDYRLAPEQPFPGAVEDAVAAYRWLVARGLDPRRLAIAGDSAGGGLTIATLVVLKDDGDSMPACGVCISPWIDLEGVGESMRTKADEDPIIWHEAITWFAGQYLADASPRLPLAAPLYAELHGLPPLLVQVGTAECLLDDARRLAERARTAGVTVELQEAEGMVHVWHMFAPVLSEARDAIVTAGTFVSDKMGADATVTA